MLTKPLVRGVLVVCGLIVLSLAGRFAVAGGRVSPAAPQTEIASNVAVAPSPIPSFTITEPVATATTSDASSPAHASRASGDDPVYLNEATVDDLRRLPGVGEKRAEAILELRKKLGRFKQIEDLLRVKGIGRSTLRRIRPLVRIDHPQAEAGAP